MDITSIFPEIISIIILTILYFIIGAIIFKQTFKTDIKTASAQHCVYAIKVSAGISL